MNTTTQTLEETLLSILKESDKERREKENEYEPLSFFMEKISKGKKRIDLTKANQEDLSEIFIRFLRKNPQEISTVIHWISNFNQKSLDNSLAREIAKINPTHLVRITSNFKDLDFFVAKAMIDASEESGASSVARCIHLFKKDIHKKIALYLIEKGYTAILKREISAFDREYLES